MTENEAQAKAETLDSSMRGMTRTYRIAEVARLLMAEAELATVKASLAATKQGMANEKCRASLFIDDITKLQTENTALLAVAKAADRCADISDYCEVVSKALSALPKGLL